MTDREPRSERPDLPSVRWQMQEGARLIETAIQAIEARQHHENAATTLRIGLDIVSDLIETAIEAVEARRHHQDAVATLRVGLSTIRGAFQKLDQIADRALKGGAS